MTGTGAGTCTMEVGAENQCPSSAHPTLGPSVSPLPDEDRGCEYIPPAIKQMHKK